MQFQLIHAIISQGFIESILQLIVKKELVHTYIFGIMIHNTFSYCSLMIFVGLTWLVSMSIQMITEQVGNAVATTDDANHHQLRKWKKSYFLTLNLIEEMDEFFGPMLLVTIARYFILIITHVYTALYQSSEYRLCGYIVLIRHLEMIITTLIWMFLLTFGTQRMKEKVTFLL